MSSAKKVIVYPGSFDPITLWHIEVIKKSCKILDFLDKDWYKLIIWIWNNHAKKWSLSTIEKIHLCEQAISHLQNENKIEIHAYDGTIFDLAWRLWSRVLIRWIRDTQDLEYESQLQQGIKSQTSKLESMYILPDPKFQKVSSSMSKSLLEYWDRLEEYVSLPTKQYVEAKFNQQYKANITWTIASGKSWLTDKFVQLWAQRWIPVHNQDLDAIAHKITNEYTQKSYQMIRDEINFEFGGDILDDNSMVDRKKLGDIVFADTTKLDLLNNIMRESIRDELVRSIKGKKWLHLINAALIAEWDISQFGNNITVLLDVDAETQSQRLQKRWYSEDEIQRRISSQFTTDRKLEELHKQITAYQWYGEVIQTTTDSLSTEDIQKLFQQLLCQVDVDGRLRFHSLLYRSGVISDMSLDLGYEKYQALLDSRHHENSSSNVFEIIKKLNQFYETNVIASDSKKEELEIRLS